MLSPKIQAFVHWIHVPFGSEDTLTAFGWSHTEFNARFFVSRSILTRYMKFNLADEGNSCV